MTIPTYLPFPVLIGAIATITAIVFGLHTALAKAGWDEHRRHGVPTNLIGFADACCFKLTAILVRSMAKKVEGHLDISLVTNY
jgi:hypothetical protein